MIYDIIVVGGGASGLAASLAAYDPHLNLLMIERDQTLGGILNQCIHNGFGLHVFKEELTGPEYAARFETLFHEQKINYMSQTTVEDIHKKDDHFVVDISSEIHGIQSLITKSVILSTGCFERTRGQIRLPGHRPKGIMPAGSAQRYLNIDGYMVGKRIFILGSGDIGLIMARRMTLEGAEVLGVAEIMPYSNGLTRNIVQCLHDFDIPLYLSHTVIDIKGKSKLSGITIAAVDHKLEPILGTEKHFEVDTLLLSVGLIPDVILFDGLKIQMDKMTKSALVNQHYEASIPGLFICGNALHVHDLVDWVTKESELAGKHAKAYALGQIKQAKVISDVHVKDDIRYVVPQKIAFDGFIDPIDFSFRTSKKATTAIFRVHQDNILIKEKKAKYVAPAEMEKITLKPSDFISQGPLTFSMEVIEL